MAKKTVVIHQPDFLPYLGFFNRFVSADLYVVLDHVQFSRAWTARDKIKTSGGVKWLTVSVKDAPLSTPINEIELATTLDWRERHLAQLKDNYASAPFFDDVFSALRTLYEVPHTRLIDFNLQSIALLMSPAQLSIPSVRSSELQPQGKGNDLVVDLLKKVGATHYLSGVGARAYFDPEPFARAGIEVLWQQYELPSYPQLHGNFTAGLSSVDAWFNCGDQLSELVRGVSV